ncbi:LOW QUALITY PROTEIN: uncharacterized protein LOC108594674 [Drosophila busckii]|nr:LOW QUALITY PROTEIN: uncharacterized protein LOC108594674 [Drosophila busckii]
MFKIVFMFMFIWLGCLGFEVRFKQSYPSYGISSDSAARDKRDNQQFFDKAGYSFDGLDRIASVPVPFPLDICMLQLPQVKYATALHKDADGARHFAVYEWQPKQQQYVQLLQQPASKAIALDCLAYAGLGYVALSFNLSEPVVQARDGSPVFELSPERGLRTVQYFAGQRLRGMYLRVSSQELTLLQAYEGNEQGQQRCPYFKWLGGSFQRLGAIPCSNARRLEAFGIDYADYVAVANYANAAGRTSTHSEIYKYDSAKRRFQLFQRLRSFGAVDVKYFSLPVSEVSRRHFLILGNTVGVANASAEADTVIYVFDNGQFVPYQRLSFFALERVLPMTHAISEKFLLLVACNKQAVKIYNMNDWKFEESTVQFTEGALSKGVARMRSYEETGSKLLVIANENMAANETNIFQPLYKQDEHANVLRQHIIEWAREQIKRLQQLNVAQLKLELQQKLSGNLQTAHIKRVNTKNFVDASRRLNVNYWDALRYAKRAVDLLEEHAAKRRGKRQTQHEFEEITVRTLLVRSKLQAGNINGLDVQQPVYNSINASKVYVSDVYKEAPGAAAAQTLENLTLQQLQLEQQATLNGHSWTELLQQTLKRRHSEVQFLKAPLVLSNLKAEAVRVNANEINERPLSQLVSVDGGDFVVQQDVRFAQPIEVQQLRINERLNHIHVDRQRLDVLTRRANHTQRIEGNKRLQHMRVLEPIAIAGQLLGAELQAVSPMKATHQQLQLTGDYVIDGDVIIGQLMQLQDLHDVATNKHRSAELILQQALPVDKPLENVNLRFEQPLLANHTELSFLNTRDLQQLVQLNSAEVQLVQGYKHLPQSLSIEQGFGEVHTLNGVSVAQLSEQLLLKSSNQTLRYAMQLGGLEAPQLTATELRLNGLQLPQYMQRSGVQHSNATLYVQQLQAQHLQVDQLRLHGKLFGHDPHELQQLAAAQRSHLWQLPANFSGSIQATQMFLQGDINNVSVAQVEQQLQQLAGNIKYVGDFSFRHPLNISTLSFSDSLNGIEAHRFGHCWLQSTGDQLFTAPQTLAGITAEQGIDLQGSLNNYTLEQFISGTYRLNSTEQLQAVQFVNPIVVEQPLVVARLNGLRVPQDMLHAQTGGSFQAPVTINGQLLVAPEQQCNVGILNGIPLDKLSAYLKHAGDTLLVEQAQFEQAPSYEKLNGYQLQQLLDEIWLDNEEIILQGVQLANASFEGLLDFEGTLNGLNAEHIGRNYFSRTRSQQPAANVALNFKHDVTFTQQLTAEQVRLRVQNGALVEGMGIGNNSLNFDDFVSNTLKTAGTHTVTGQWHLPEATVQASLHHVSINQLNLVDDVLRSDNRGITTITAPKYVKSAAIKRLFATPSSTVAGVPVAQWINNTVYIYGNHSIKGTTILESVNLYNDLRVAGTVNGIHWQPDQLILCNQEQQIPGALVIDNTLAEQQRILSNNMEELWVDRIDGLDVNELLENKAHNRPNLHVESKLIFSQPITVANYEFSGVPENVGRKLKRGVHANKLEDWSQLDEELAALQERLAESAYVLDSFTLVHKQNVTDFQPSEDSTLSGDYYLYNTTLLNTSTPTDNTKQLDKINLEQLVTETAFVSTLHLGTYGDCLAIQKQHKEDLVIYCPVDSNGIMGQQGVISTEQIVRQLLVGVPESGLLALLGQNAVEFWRWNGNYSLEQRLNISAASKMAFAAHEQRNYLAVLTASGIQVYSAGDTSILQFELEQVLHLELSEQPPQFCFAKLEKSKDLLLALSYEPLKSLHIYQHQGVAGFVPILASNTLQTLPLKLQLTATRDNELALVNGEDIYVLVPQFTKL